MGGFFRISFQFCITSWISWVLVAWLLNFVVPCLQGRLVYHLRNRGFLFLEWLVLIACCIAGDAFLPCFCSCLGWGSNAPYVSLLLEFFSARTFTGQTYYNRIHFCSVCFNKSSYGPIVHSHLLQHKCAYFYCPVNRVQARAAFMGFVLDGVRKT